MVNIDPHTFESPSQIKCVKRTLDKVCLLSSVIISDESLFIEYDLFWAT